MKENQMIFCIYQEMYCRLHVYAQIKACFNVSSSTGDKSMLKRYENLKEGSQMEVLFMSFHFSLYCIRF